ncbi:hypothetical protein OG777_17375 [Micromonospora peucetia]|nr:hypothetical protein [Micromonospora peucetia]MCX4388694.1 hypothetical protein [Micromonospora peucetia]
MKSVAEHCRCCWPIPPPDHTATATIARIAALLDLTAAVLGLLG